MALGPRGDKRADIGDGRIVAKNFTDGVDERALAVGAGAVEEHEFVLKREPGAAVAAEPLKEFLQLDIAGSDAVEECGPNRMRRSGRCCGAGGLFGDVVCRLRRTAFAGL